MEERIAPARDTNWFLLPRPDKDDRPPKGVDNCPWVLVERAKQHGKTKRLIARCHVLAKEAGFRGEF